MTLIGRFFFCFFVVFLGYGKLAGKTKIKNADGVLDGESTVKKKNCPSREYVQQSLAKYSGLRMTQTVYGCGLALRVVCVNFLNTCPIAP